VDDRPVRERIGERDSELDEPVDDLCVGGEWLADEPVDSTWSMRGRLVELRPA
jgi:hypothetical protein